MKMCNTDSTRKDNLMSDDWKEFPYRLGKGPAERAAIGLIALANDLVIEQEINYFVGIEGAAVFADRIPFEPDATLENLVNMKNDIKGCVERLAPIGELDVIAFGCNSGSIAIGPATIEKEVNQVMPDVKCTTPISATIKALRALNCRKLAILTPYIDEINTDIANYLEKWDLVLAAKGSFKVLSAKDVSMIDPNSIYDAGLRLGGHGVDALFLPCTALRVSPVLEELEKKIQKPVITSNQAMAWHCLRLSGIDEKLSRVGQFLGKKGI